MFRKMLMVICCFLFLTSMVNATSWQCAWTKTPYTAEQLGSYLYTNYQGDIVYGLGVGQVWVLSWHDNFVELSPPEEAIGRVAGVSTCAGLVYARPAFSSPMFVDMEMNGMLAGVFDQDWNNRGYPGHTSSCEAIVDTIGMGNIHAVHMCGSD